VENALRQGIKWLGIPSSTWSAMHRLGKIQTAIRPSWMRPTYTHWMSTKSGGGPSTRHVYSVGPSFWSRLGPKLTNKWRSTLKILGEAITYGDVSAIALMLGLSETGGVWPCVRSTSTAQNWKTPSRQYHKHIVCMIARGDFIESQKPIFKTWGLIGPCSIIYSSKSGQQVTKPKQTSLWGPNSI
jgi:hypothetical protein